VGLVNPVEMRTAMADVQNAAATARLERDTSRISSV